MNTAEMFYYLIETIVKPLKQYLVSNSGRVERTRVFKGIKLFYTVNADKSGIRIFLRYTDIPDCVSDIAVLRDVLQFANFANYFIVYRYER